MLSYDSLEERDFYDISINYYDIKNVYLWGDNFLKIREGVIEFFILNSKNKNFIKKLNKLENFNEELIFSHISFITLKSLSQWGVEFKKKENVILTSINVFNIILEYHKKFTYFYELEYSLNDRNFFIMLLGFLSKKNIISENYNYNAKKKKTFITYFISGNQMMGISFNIFNVKPIIRENFTIFNHYSAIFEIIRPNKRSNKYINLKSKLHFENLYNTEIFLDFEELNCQIKDIIEIKNLNKHSFLKDLENELKELYDKLLDAYKFIWKNKHIIGEISKEMSEKILYYKLFSFHKYYEKRNFLNKIYIPIYYDFRGRRYYDSPVAPTAHSFFRQIYYYGKYENDFIFKKTPVISLIIEKYEEDIRKKIGISLKGKNLEPYFWIIISISYLNRNKNKESYSIDEFFNVKWDEHNLSVKDKILYRYLIRLIAKLENFPIKKNVIPKDATASVYQQLMLLLEGKNEKSYKICNLANCFEWVDTYSYILNKFKEKKINENEEYKKMIDLLNRNNTKSTIMTAPYASTKFTCYEYFIHNNGDKVSDNLRKVFYDFYDFVNETLETDELFKKKSITLINTADYMIYGWDSELDLKYFKIKNLRVDKIINVSLTKKVRITSKYNVLTQNIDNKKVLSSFRANLIHFKDAETIRKVEYLMNRHFLTIHDCFLVDIFSVSDFVYQLNKAIQDSNRISLFIVI